jgi:hypothetical protein
VGVTMRGHNLVQVIITSVGPTSDIPFLMLDAHPEIFSTTGTTVVEGTALVDIGGWACTATFDSPLDQIVVEVVTVDDPDLTQPTFDVLVLTAGHRASAAATLRWTPL